MASVYTIGSSLGMDPNSTNELSLSPQWLMCCVRFEHRTTYSRTLKKSQSLDPSEVVAEARPLIIRRDCTQLSVTKNKRSCVGNLVANLKAGDRNYLAEITPGDWILAWMLQSPEEADEVERKIRAGEPCNQFNDGLKFVGRVYSVQKTMSVTADGKKSLGYSVQGNSFAEFNSMVFYDKSFEIKDTFIGTWLGRLGIAINEFITAEGIDVNKAIPTLLDVLLGRGIGQQAANPSGDPLLQAVTGLTSSKEAPYAYAVPKTVAKLLGRVAPSKPVFSYADLLNSMFGIQKYTTNTEVLNVLYGGTPDYKRIFRPARFRPMLGSFTPAVSSFNGKTVWAALEQYLNPAINEMFTCLRMNAQGEVLPTLVVRQLPFSSTSEGDRQTGFLEVPRWKPPDAMVTNYLFSRSDAMRLNFVHVLAQAQAQARPDNTQQQLLFSPPIRDDQDIRRSGLRADIQTVACGIRDQELGPKEWVDIRTDILMGGHMLLSGTVEMYLVQEPICEGDNFEYEGVVFHIESVTHTCATSEDGRRHAGTTLQLSYGVRSDDPEFFRAPDIDSELSRYAVLDPQDSTLHDPGFTAENNDRSGARKTKV